MINVSPPATFEEKCNIICGAVPPAALQTVFCKPGTAVGPASCDYQTPGIPTTLTCRPARATVVSIERCSPIDETDPVSIVAELEPTSRGVFTPHGGGDAGVAQLGGFIALTLSDCTGPACPITLRRIHLRVGTFAVAGDTISDGAMGLVGNVPGTLLNQRTLTIPPSALTIWVRGRLASDGVDREGALQTSTPATGVLDYEAGLLNLSLQVSSNALGLDATATVIAKLVNRPPIVRVSVPAGAECSANGKGLVHVDASASFAPDRPASPLTFDWFIDGAPAGAHTAAADLLVPLGRHTVLLRVADVHERVTKIERQVDVVDTTPPRIVEIATAGPVCLWPPNHKYVVLELGQDFYGVLEDACDPAPRLRITGVTSSQPDDGLGDGNTNSDALFNSTRVCLRSERAGSDPAGRAYHLQLVATDATGNTSPSSLNVSVPHDQAGNGCAMRIGRRGATDAAECASDPAVEATVIPEQPAGRAGCSHASGWAVAALLAALARRRNGLGK